MMQTDLQSELEQLHTASFGWAFWCCDQRTDEAEEVLQSAYLKALEGKARFDGRSSFRTWFFSVIRRTAWEQRRRRWVRDEVLGRWLGRQSTAVDATDPEAEASVSESSRALRKALAALPARQQQVLHLVFYQELTIEEASQILGISLGTARTHFERGKSQLRRVLGEEKGQHAQQRSS